MRSLPCARIAATAARAGEYSGEYHRGNSWRIDRVGRRCGHLGLDARPVAGGSGNALPGRFDRPHGRHGHALRVRDTGPKSAPVLIFMHGFGSSLETWEPWARLLSDKYRVVRFDFPGSGLSEPDRTGDYSDARSLQLVKALMQQLGIERAVLIGNSMGGRIAWKFAAAYPTIVSKLILISPTDSPVLGSTMGGHQRSRRFYS
jgi:pimeloyl-ACP methyl ester carboxylesterase